MCFHRFIGPERRAVSIQPPPSPRSLSVSGRYEVLLDVCRRDSLYVLQVSLVIPTVVDQPVTSPRRRVGSSISANKPNLQWNMHSGRHFERGLPLHPAMSYLLLTFLKGLLPPPNASGSTGRYPLCLRLPPDRLGGLCSSITSTISSSRSTGALLVSSNTTVSLLTSLSLRGGLLRGGLRCLVSIISLTDRLLETVRRGDRDRRRTTTSSSPEAEAPPMLKAVYMSPKMRRKPHTEPKTIPTTSPGGGPASRPE
jgi:hypothetical protein